MFWVWSHLDQRNHQNGKGLSQGLWKLLLDNFSSADGDISV